MQLEFFPKSIRDFQAGAYSFAPFVSLGVHFTAYNPKVYRLPMVMEISITLSNFLTRFGSLAILVS